MEHHNKDQAAFEVRDLPTATVTRETFAPFGEFIEAVRDDEPYGDQDARLDLSGGIPRYYVMAVQRPGIVFGHITRHRRTTQCLASSDGSAWFIAVAPPLGLDIDSAEPDLAAIKGFIIPGHTSVKFNKGTWHAGPYFAEPEQIRFFNLELADTNQVDHHSSNLTKRFGLKLRFSPV